MAKERTLNLPDGPDAPGDGVAEAMREAQPDPANESPAEFQARAAAQARQEIEAFEEWAAGLIETAHTAMKERREALGIEAQYRREREKFNQRDTPTLDEHGEVNPDDEDAHKRAGIGTGLFIDACTVIPPIISGALVNPGGMPYELKPTGRRQENPLKKKIIEALVARQLEKSGWRAEVTLGLEDLPRHGTFVLRQSWGETLAMRVGRDGRMYEDVGYRGMLVRKWSLLDCFVSHPHRPWATDQEAVIWVSQTNLGQLAQQERAFRLVQRLIQGDFGLELEPMVEEVGEHVGLERLEGDTSQEAEFIERTTTESELASEDGTTGAGISYQTAFDQFEFQGYFPIGYAIRTGKMTPAVMKYYHINLNLDGQRVFGEQAARLADRLMWYLTWVKPDSTAKGVSERGYLTQCEPCPYRRQITELISGYFIGTGGFYGLSADGLGGAVELTADKVLNDIILILDNNANPNTLVNGAAFDSIRKVEDLFKKLGEVISTDRANGDVNNIASYLTKPYDASFQGILEKLIEIYTTRTMSSQSLKGGAAQTESNTLGESQQQIQMTERRLAAIIQRLATQQVVVRSIERCIEDTDWFMSDEELEHLAVEIAGQHGLDAKAILPTGEAAGTGTRISLVDEFEVKPAAQAAIQKEVAIQFLTQIAAASAAVPGVKTAKMYQAAFDWLGMDGEAFFEDEEGPMSPRKELLMILAGDRPEPDPQENAGGEHWPAHQQQMAILQGIKQQQLAAGQSTEAVDGWIDVLAIHLEETQELAMSQMIQAAQQAEMMAQQAPVAGKGGKSAGSGAPPPSGQRIAQGMAANAAGAPGGMM